MASAAFQVEMARQQDSRPKLKIEFISPASVATDVTAYYVSGANFSFRKERAPDQIQAGNFDVVLKNQDNYFSEFVTASILYGINYIAASIRISHGFVLTTGAEEYVAQATGLIDQITVDETDSTVTFRCRDRMQLILDSVMRPRPASETVIANAANAGNGGVTQIETKPFTNVSQSWTVTCTTPGGDSTALFSVVGSVSGSIGPATSGTEFSSSSGGIKFTIQAGTSNWSIGDSFTFTTIKSPEWNLVNPIKIIWAALTGYNWDTDTQETWYAAVLNYDHTKSDANTDLDYNTFVSAITAVDVTCGNIKGYCPYEKSPQEFFESLILLFGGSMFTGGDGRVQVKAFAPSFGGTAVSAAFTDALKITLFGYLRTKDEIINSITATFRPFDSWEFSDVTPAAGVLYFEDTASIAIYKRLPFSFSSPWYQSNGTHVESVAQRLLLRYSAPPVTYTFQTGLDAVLTEIGDLIALTDTKYNRSAIVAEVIEVTKNFDAEPMTIHLSARDEPGITDTAWAFLGSSANEGDGLSPQALNYDSATTANRYFAYLGQTGGGGGPNYRIF